MERILVLVLYRSVTESVLCLIRSDQTNDPQVVFWERVQKEGVAPSMTMIFVAHMLPNGRRRQQQQRHKRTAA